MESIPTRTPGILLSPVTTQSPASPATASEKRGLTFIDVHDHLFPHIIESSEIIETMDEYGISLMVNMQEPCQIYISAPPSSEGIPDLSEKYPDRFISLYSNEAVLLLDHVAESGSPTISDEEKYTALLEEAMRSGKYRGFGEVALRHGTVSVDGGMGNTGCANVFVPGDHPWMFIMSDIAAKYDVPIDIHMEKPEVMLPGFERLLEHNRNTTIIWSHTGWNVAGYSTPEVWRQLLKKHPNLYGSIKCRPFVKGDLVSLVLEDKTISEEWLALFQEFPGRFMIGTDIKPGQRAGEFNFVPAHFLVLKSLPRDVQIRIAQENAMRIYKIQKTVSIPASKKTLPVTHDRKK
jgi:hypothetical protein